MPCSHDPKPQMEDSETKLNAAQKRLAQVEEELDGVMSERNAARRKLASLQKDMGRMLQGDSSVDDVEELRSSHKELQTKAKLLEAENKRLQDELESHQSAHRTRSSVRIALPLYSHHRPPSSNSNRLCGRVKSLKLQALDLVRNK